MLSGDIPEELETNELASLASGGVFWRSCWTLSRYTTWRIAIEGELQSHLENETSYPAQLPPGREAISSK